jgi:outer membrane murein-binding lipoprotein Lpp
MKHLSLILASLVLGAVLAGGCALLTDPTSPAADKEVAKIDKVIDPVADAAAKVKSVADSPEAQAVAAPIPYGNTVLLGVSSLAGLILAGRVGWKKLVSGRKKPAQKLLTGPPAQTG